MESPDSLKNIKSNTRGNIRLLIVAIYIALQFSFYAQYILKNKHILRSYVEIILFALFLLAELWEYSQSYKYSRKYIPTILFLLRLTPVVLGILYEARVLPYIPFLTLLVFYSFYGLARPVSLSIVILVPLVILVYDYLTGSSPFYLAYSIPIMVLFYFFALFLQKEQRIAQENRALYDRLRESQQQLQEYAEKVGDNVVLAERTRLSRDIHDSVGHALTAIQVQLNKAMAYYDRDRDTSLVAVQEARTAAGRAMSDIRGFLGTIDQEPLSFPLQSELKNLVQQLADSDCCVSFEYKGSDKTYDYSILLTVFRLVQEGITNIMRHSRADEAALNVVFGDDGVSIFLSDNGIGFDMAKAAGRSLGLQGLKQRIELVYGSLVIDSAANTGCRIQIWLPKHPVSLLTEENT